MNTDLIKCPFVPYHYLRKEKIASHITKCRNSLKEDSPYYNSAWNMVVCKYNSTHYIHKENLEKHYENCEFYEKYKDQNQPLSKFHWEKFVGTEVPNNTEENWDDEETIESYDPMKKIYNNPNILFNPIGMTKSQRKDFRTNRKLQANGFKK